MNVFKFAYGIYCLFLISLGYAWYFMDPWHVFTCLAFFWWFLFVVAGIVGE